MDGIGDLIPTHNRPCYNADGSYTVANGLHPIFLIDHFNFEG